MSDIIIKETINSLVDKSSFDIVVLKSVNSTNSYAKALAKFGSSHETVVIADRQTAGRGRLGREFFSPAGTGIYMSVLLDADKISLASSHITVAAGVAVCRVLKDICNDTPFIKWVNDIFIGRKKVCGILAESLGNPSHSISNIIVGIGLNVTTPSADFPDELNNIAGSIFPKNTSRNEIIAKILTEFKSIYKSSDIEGLIKEYKKHSFVLEKKISFIQNGKAFSGIAKNINNEGNLIVKLENGETITLKSGDVSLGSESFAI